MNQSSRWVRFSDAEKDKASLLSIEPVDECWRWDKFPYQFPIQVHYLGKRNYGNMTHITIKKINMADAARNPLALLLSEEPTYDEKLKIVGKIIDDSRTIAMEVFPAQKNVVDAANLYHVWVADKKCFPFDTIMATHLPEGKEWEHEYVNGLEIEYMVKVIKTVFGKMSYLFLRRCDGKELIWREKQLLKNELQYEGIVAVEIISKFGKGKETCLMCLPLDHFLDFGLHRLEV